MGYKWISQAFIPNWANLKLYSRFWLNKTIDTLNFKHWSLTVRFGWWYFDIQRKEK